MTELNKLLEMIKEEPVVKRYLEIRPIVNQNKDVLMEITRLKIIQKELVKAREFNLEKKVILLEKDHEAILIKIGDIPLVGEYLELQEQINEILAAITNIFVENLQ